MRVLVFELFGDFAHFRKFYTTSSPLTYPFPPPPTIKGIIGAIMGFSKSEYLKKTKHISVGIGLVNPVKKTRMGLNLIYTKGGPKKFDPTLDPLRKENKNLRTQIKAEFVKDPKYRIYISTYDDELLESLKNRLENHESYYTVSLGLSELLADFKFVGVFEGEKVESAEKIDTVVPVSLIQSIDLVRTKD